LWAFRIGLLASFVIHVWTTVLLVLENRRARGVSYAVTRRQTATWASRTMIWGGLALGAFVVYHLLHFTTGHVHHGQFERYGHADVYSRVVASFQEPGIVIAYLAAMVFLFFHLVHGIQSLFETLGVTHPGVLACARRGGPVLALVIVLGFASVPIAVWAGIIR
jgi:succinate dehydrogenase / fumarate reductase cytochrome b subunit